MLVTLGVAALCHDAHPTSTLEQAGGHPLPTQEAPDLSGASHPCALGRDSNLQPTRLLRIEPSAQLRDKVVAPGEIHVGPLPEQLDRGVAVPAVEQIGHLGDQCGIELP